MTILKFSADNFKKLSVVQITPDGNLVVIGGSNAQGKSSILDAIYATLGGADAVPSKPVRRGEARAQTELEIGEKGKTPEIVVRRTFTAAGGTTLTVTNADGVKFSSPQEMLDKLVGPLSFDPLEFAVMKPQQRSETLQSLAGLSFEQENVERAKLFDDRTVANRELKTLAGRLQAMPEHAVEGGERSIADLAAELRKANEANTANMGRRMEMGKQQAKRDNINDSMKRCENEIEQLKKQLIEVGARLVEREQALEKAQVALDALTSECAAMRDIDTTPFEANMANAETHNRMVRQNEAKRELRAAWQAKGKECDGLTAKVEAIDAAKRRRILEAKFPIEGLSLDDSMNVIFNGLPFEQSSTAEQLRASVAIGLALNRGLPILLIRRGSDLDPTSLKLVAEMAEKANAQVWIETSRTDAPVTVVMEDGHVKEAP